MISDFILVKINFYKRWLVFLETLSPAFNMNTFHFPKIFVEKYEIVWKEGKLFLTPLLFG